MSKIERYKVCTNLNENFCAPKINPPSQDWVINVIHETNRGRVIAFARLLYAPLLKVFPNSRIQTRLGKKVVNRHIKFAKYLPARMNLSEFYLGIVNHNLNVVFSHIHALLMLVRFIAHQLEHCGIKNKNAFRQLN